MPENRPPSPGGASPRLALRFISGKYQGGEFPLEEGREIIVGRSSELDMVLVEELVSRRHARILVRGGSVTLEDLGSTNGTFVNGEKIVRAQLGEGDRVLIGTSILRVVKASPPQAGPGSQRATTQRRPPLPRTQTAASTQEAPRMTGRLEEIPLPDLLQLFGTSRKNGVLVLRTPDLVGRIVLRNGVIHHARIESQPELFPLKAIFRMLAWREGTFELEPPDPRTFEPALDATAQEVLMEGFRQHDELAAMRPRLPPPTARLALATPLAAPLHELDPAHLELLQTALNLPNTAALFDASRHLDLDTARMLEALLRRGYLRPV